MNSMKRLMVVCADFFFWIWSLMFVVSVSCSPTVVHFCVFCAVCVVDGNKDVHMMTSVCSWAQINPLSQRTERRINSLNLGHTHTHTHKCLIPLICIHSTFISIKTFTEVTWHTRGNDITRRDPHSPALEGGGGIRAAATNRLSLDRKLNVAHAFGCKRRVSDG